MDLDNTAAPGLQGSQHGINNPSTPGGPPPPGSGPAGPGDRGVEQEMPSIDLQVICALITLEWIQVQCMKEKPAQAAQKTQASGDKMRILTRLSELIRRRPGEAVAVYARLLNHETTLEISQNDGITKDNQFSMDENVISDQDTKRLLEIGPDNMDQYSLDAFLDLVKCGGAPQAAEKHVKRLENLVRGKFKASAWGPEVGLTAQNEPELKYMRQYLTAATFLLFWHHALSSFMMPGCSWELPPVMKSTDERVQGKTDSKSKLYNAAEEWFTKYHGEICDKKSTLCVRRALNTIKGAANSQNPMQAIIFASELMTPGQMNPSHEYLQMKYMELQLPLEKCRNWLELQEALKKLKMTSECMEAVWAKVPYGGVEGVQAIDRIKRLQEDVKRETPGGSAKTGSKRHNKDTHKASKTYLELVSLLLYTTRALLQYFGNMVQLWFEYEEKLNRKGKSLSSDRDTTKQLIRAILALSNAQDIWHELMRVPRTAAWGLHLVQGKAIANKNPSGTTAPDKANGKQSSHTIPRGTQPLQQDKEEEINEDDEPVVFKQVQNDINNLALRQMLFSCFCLGVVTRRQREAGEDIKKNLRQDSKTLLKMTLVPNEDGQSYQGRVLKSALKSYWAKLDQQLSGALKQRCTKILKQIADSEMFVKNPEGLGLDFQRPPKAHCEAILLSKWFTKHQKSKFIPPIGVSRPACGTCTAILDKMLQVVYGSEPELPSAKAIVPGTRADAFWFCMLPEETPDEVKDHVLKILEDKIRTRFNTTATYQGMLTYRKKVLYDRRKAEVPRDRSIGSVGSVGYSKQAKTDPRKSKVS